MNIAFYSGRSGMMAYQKDMDVIAHNVANVNTTGYKPMRSVFSDLLYSQMAVNVQGDFLQGHGVRQSDIDLVFKQGPVLSSGNSLDFAIIGSGFFALQREDGQIEYTRNGAFDISLYGDQAFLVASDGSFVLDANGERIELQRTGGADTPFSLEGVPERLGVYQFSNPFGLQPSPGGRFLQTANSGQAIPTTANNADAPYRLVQSALESSGVDLADEMVMVMTTQKAFQFSARLVQTADQLEEIVNNLR